MADIATIRESYYEKVHNASSLEYLLELETAILGRNGIINDLLKNIKDIEPDKRKEYGMSVNQLKKELSELILDKRTELLAKKDTGETIDVTIPGTIYPKGSLHLISMAIEEISRIFEKIGFIRVSYPEVEYEFFSFESLNMPKTHAARDDIETSFIDAPAHPEYGKMLLTPHTSSGQVREMWRVGKPPIRMINIAKTYRPNWDATHTPMFFQFEGLCVDREINITHLKGTLDYFVKQYFGPDIEARLRPHHFQFTEPSFEVDITCTVCKGTGKVSGSFDSPHHGSLRMTAPEENTVKCKVCKSGWLELGGTGMVHPNVLKAGKINPKEYSGWAFGFGIERVIMMKYGIDDIRNYYTGDIRFFGTVLIMNIKITHKWLLDFLDTDATPQEIQKYLSLSGPSVERVEETANGDFVYDIEITTNRIDSASVYGIALECQAILPMYGKKAVLKNDPLKTYKLGTTVGADNDLLKVSFGSPDLCSRFTVSVLDTVTTKPSPAFIQERLNAIGIKVINNVVDISNYLMVTLGQPTHVFDYDKVGQHSMKVRESRKGETITTLDGKTITLPGADIVIEDGNGDLIDLCGIMGGLNSSFTDKTKKVVLFVQTYNKAKIRRTSMVTGQRTIAATYFEKGLDEERVAPTLAYGVELMEKYAGAKQMNSVIDIRSKTYSHRTIAFTQSEIDTKIGVHIEPEKIEHILRALGFPIARKDNTFEVTVPSYRQYDVEITEDIVEEIARIYGYHNLPNNLPPLTYVEQPPAFERLFLYQSRIKLFLKHLGLHEVLNYSMISMELIENFGLKTADHLMLANVLSEEIKYLRTSLLPSLIKNIKLNEGKRAKLKLFELAKIYLPQPGNLPQEVYRLAIGVTTSYDDLKGIIEALVHELNIANSAFSFSDKPYFSLIQSEIKINGKSVGTLGRLKQTIQDKYAVKSPCYLAELDFQALTEHARTISTYTPVHPYSIIKLDVTYTSRPDLLFEGIKQRAIETSTLLTGIEVVSRFEKNITLRFYFSSPGKNVTEEEAKKELSIIKKAAGL